MKCKQAREILNLLTDGESHARADEAREHLARCAACREWKAGMEQVLSLLEAAPSPESVDIAAAVMARLPDRHPASLRQRRSPVARVILAWTGACWLIGMAAVCGLVLMLPRWVSVDSLSGPALRAYHMTRAFEPFLGSLGTAAHSVLHAVRGLSGDIGVVITGVSPLLIQFVVLDAAFLLAVFAIWWSRRRLARASHILA